LIPSLWEIAFQDFFFCFYLFSLSSIIQEHRILLFFFQKINYGFKYYLTIEKG